jgi:hypothetical protein
VAFDEALAARVRNVLPNGGSVVEKRMFGGIAFLLNDNASHARPPRLGQGRKPGCRLAGGTLARR